MTTPALLAETRAADHDDGVAEGINQSLVVGSGESFITFAGAGSGKTYSLEQALHQLRDMYAIEFAKQQKQIAVITFTNNAADEIKERVEQSEMFSISTIHSFCWQMITGFNEDIRKWYISQIPGELSDLEDKEKKGRAGAASDARKRRITRLKEKLEWLSEPRTFIYDPNGVNSAPNSLSHADVLKIFSDFVATKPMMAEILVSKFPFIFVDESQDTDKDVIHALFELKAKKDDEVTLGLFGDTMQRIFGGGEAELGKSLPDQWKTLNKEVNHRSAQRIVGLGNAIRMEDDQRLQFATDTAENGIVRYYLLPQGLHNKDEIEARIRSQMAEVTGDQDWINTESMETAILLLEHRMASRRLGFDALIEALSASKSIRDRVFEGDDTELNFFSKVVWPLSAAISSENKFQVMAILRNQKSPLLREGVFREYAHDPLQLAREAELALRELTSSDAATFGDVLNLIAQHQLLSVPTKLTSFITEDETADEVTESDVNSELVEDIDEEEALKADAITAWTAALQTPFSQVQHYQNYIDDNSIYRTHQGVKGNEFERVMVIMDDDEAGGFMFSYDQYFGAKEPSANTLKKIAAGEETGLDRTRRLFYVTSTRAKQSLVHVIYTSDCEKVMQNLIARGFAEQDEITVEAA